MQSVKRTFIDHNTGQLHLRFAGKQSHDSAIVCLHMVPKSSRIFEKLMPALAANHFVIAPDYPGYGESSHFPVDHIPSIDDYVDSVVTVIKQYDLERIALVGYHTGSMVAVELATQYPDLIERLICIGLPILTSTEVDQYMSYFSPIPLDKAGTRFRVMWERIMHFAGPGFTLQMAADSMAENLRGGDRYEDGHAAAFNYSAQLPMRLQSLEQPIWVMNINDDLFEQSQRVDPYLNNGYRTDFADLGNGCLWLEPELVAKQMLEFINTQEYV